MLLAYLEIALQPFTGQPTSTSARIAGIRVMPTRKQLLDAGTHCFEPASTHLSRLVQGAVTSSTSSLPVAA